MATGDLANNLRKLQKELKLIKFTENVDLTGLSQGTPTSLLPIYHYLFTSYSHAIAEFISSSDIELYGKTDFRFIEAVYKIMRDLFSYKPPVTKEQFFNAGFAERKIIMCADVIQMIREKNKSLLPNKKPATSAVSTISHNLHKKTARPKTTAEPGKSSQQASGKSLGRPQSADHQKQVKFATEEVVNELRQPLKQQKSRHVVHKNPPSPVAIVNMSPTVTKEVVRIEEHPQQRGFKYAVVTPAVAKQPNRSSKCGESAVSKGLQFEDSIEVVTATTPDTSLYEPLHNSTSIVHEEMQQQLTTLQNSVEVITERLSGFESAMLSVTKSASDQCQSSTDPKLLDIVTRIQQQLENLTARMVLIENRVSIVESKLQPSSTVSIARGSEPKVVLNGHGEQQAAHIHPSLTQGYPPSYSHDEQRYMSTRSQQNDIQGFRSPKYQSSEKVSTEYRPSEPSGYTTSDIPQNEQTTRNMQSKEVKDLLNQQQSTGVEPVHSETSVKPSITSNTGNTSIPQHMLHSDDFSFALSPIRTIKDTSGYKPGPNATGEDTFALEAEDDARRSSTPTDFKDLPLKPECNDSISYHFGDVSTQERVDRIKNLMASTKTMLNK